MQLAAASSSAAAAAESRRNPSGKNNTQHKTKSELKSCSVYVCAYDVSHVTPAKKPPN
jgi:hypothetical protein